MADEAPEDTGRWWAQHALWPDTEDPIPDTHKHYADEGSTLEATFRAMEYVPVPAPGSDDPVDDTEPEEPADSSEDVEADDESVGDQGAEVLVGLPMGVQVARPAPGNRKRR